MLMSTYTADELLRKWKQGSLSSDQALGHLLQHLTAISERLAHLERCIALASGGGTGGSGGAAPPTTPPRRKP
jgi:hypothetical protein